MVKVIQPKKLIADWEVDLTIQKWGVAKI